MCSLLGFTGKKLPDVNALKLMLIDAENRGKDATGLYVPEKGTFKSISKSSEFVYDKDIEEYMNSKLVMGHTRHATIGANSIENAHPFFFDTPEGKLVGAHNGWLIEPKDQAKKLGIEWPGVDSKVIFQYFIEKGFSFYHLNNDIHGAMALSFYFNNRLYLYRRSSKPLYIAETDDGIYWHSRKEGLKLAGFNDIIKIPENLFLGFEEGVIVDRRYYGEEEYVMSEDCSPAGWRSHDYDKARILFPTYSSDSRTKSKQLSFFENNKSKEEILSLFSNESKEIYDSLDDNDIDELKISGVMKLNGIYTDSSTLIAAKINLPISEENDEWFVFIDKSPDSTFRRLSKNGLAVMEIHPNEDIESCRIILKKESEKDIYYTREFSIKDMSVLEVALDIRPFLEKEEEFDEDEGDTRTTFNGGSNRYDRGLPFDSDNRRGTTGEYEDRDTRTKNTKAHILKFLPSHITDESSISIKTGANSVSYIPLGDLSFFDKNTLKILLDKELDNVSLRARPGMLMDIRRTILAGEEPPIIFHYSRNKFIEEFSESVYALLNALTPLLPPSKLLPWNINDEHLEKAYSIFAETLAKELVYYDKDKDFLKIKTVKVDGIEYESSVNGESNMSDISSLIDDIITELDDLWNITEEWATKEWALSILNILSSVRQQSSSLEKMSYSIIKSSYYSGISKEKAREFSSFHDSIMEINKNIEDIWKEYVDSSILLEDEMNSAFLAGEFYSRMCDLYDHFSALSNGVDIILDVD